MIIKKLLYFLFITLIVGFFGCKKEVVNPDFIKSFNLSSKETGIDYTISIKLPEDYHTSSEIYHTMYVLDAEQVEEYVSKVCEKTSKELNTQNVIVIGIKYQKGNYRDTDYTPTPTDHGKGGSTKFLNFIQKELIPRIESEFRAAPARNKRTILGHSFGGLFGAFALTKHNDLFGNYLLLSPSLFYDNSIVLQYEKEARPIIKRNSQLVVISLGGTEKGLIPGNDYLHQHLKSFYTNTTSYFHLVPGKGHIASRNPSIEKAIKFYFKNR
ncbi:alpha/beta hydrolase [Adhaeribacter aquaticus]|uniref:alpha/beta hydrolase n=1 Tax=Adhaeribacter aquaticus TaxID=299567 RepID=UPI00040C6666|nr:alpha/beta hydrolase-fold protein [Adhaeribacter aquaticus]